MNINDINKKITLDLDQLEQNDFALLSGFRSQAIKEVWTSDEIMCVWKHATKLDFQHLTETLNRFIK